MSYEALNADQRGGYAPSGKPSLTIDAAAANLTREGLSWGGQLGQPVTVSYAYRASTPSVMPTDTAGFQQFGSRQIDATERALQLWSDVANIRFVRVGSGNSGAGAYSDDATILFGDYASGQDGASGFAYLPGSTRSTSAAGDVWINSALGLNGAPSAGDEGFLTLLHEIGHAIGLSHPSDYEAGRTEPTYAADASYNEDSLEYSVMSYFDLSYTGGSTIYYGQPRTPLIDDVAAAQRLYGANLQANAGDTLYGANPFSAFAPGAIQGSLYVPTNGAVYGTIWDAGGTDTIDCGYVYDSQKIDLRAGSFSDVNGGIGTLSIALGVTIENAVGGSGNDVLIGNDVANQLIGNDGNDTLTGGRGDDLLSGGNGDDRAIIDASFAATGFALAGGDLLLGSPDGSDTLRNIETVALSDRTISMASITGTDGLYRTFMGRGAAGDELHYWLDQIAAGRGLDTVRSAILSDPFGHAHTLATVDGFYTALMGRSAQSSELGYWEGQVKAGTSFDAVHAVIAADPSALAYSSAAIDHSYHEYLGRAARPDEIGYWSNQFAHGTSLTQFHAALASDYFAGNHITVLIGEAYLTGLNRYAGADEYSYWTSALKSGVSIRDMQRTIANDTTMTGQSATQVIATYQHDMGRAPTQAEMDYWDQQIKLGAGLSDVRHAIMSDPYGNSYATSTLPSLYQEYFDRAPTSAEVTTWSDLFRSGATLDTARITMMLDPSASGVHVYSAAARSTGIDLRADIGHNVVNDFTPTIYVYNPDPYAGAGLTLPDLDWILLMNSGFVGNPLSPERAHEVTELSGRQDVLISYDLHHDILITDMTIHHLELSGAFSYPLN